MSDADATPDDAAASSPLETTGIYHPIDPASELVRVLDEYLAELQAGQAPDKARLLADHPELARELENCLAGIDFVHRAAKPEAATPTQLGDFRILREVGRGGMGVVYMAEQLSLKRKVALKVLRFGVTADPDVMQRFQREAETVAHLHHTNIVPIHAIGCEQGVHYYAMQFIEGQSLATVLNDTGRAANVNFKEIAGWVLQAAEALAHAHQRGVIHRDIKPSNLILDPQGTVWLTDFGLAKRADEVTLTAAGILMGTPRYMSPEQAAAAKQPVDHRTDIYSLGATLYELATGQPVFDGQTPQGVITQILNAEPVPPRLLQGKLPRDLETIILKCLAKEPSRRYQQARELADELRAFLDNRAIRARRTSIAERTVRWVKKHQRSTTVAVVTATVSLLLIAIAIAGWSTYRESLNGRLLLTTDGPALVAEVLDDRDEPVIPGFPVPNAQPVVLPAGTYRVRLSGSGQLSETWTVDVERGQQRTHSVKLLDRMLAPPLELPGSDPPVWLKLNGESHLFHRSERGWRLTRGDTLSPAWSNDLTKLPEKPDGAQYPNTSVGGVWHDLLQLGNARVSGETGSAPGVAQPPVDVNGDNKDDLILASRVSPSLVAVSGSDGRVLWWYRALPNFPKDHDAAQDPFNLKGSAETAGVIHQPIVVRINGEPVVIAVYVSHSSSLNTQSGKKFTSGQTFYMEAVAARSGTQVWRTVFELPELATTDAGEFLAHFSPQPVAVTLNGRQTVVLHVGTKLFGFDLHTGGQVWPPVDLGAHPVQLVQFADLNGDRQPDALCVTRKDQNSQKVNLRAVSLTSRETLWERAFLCPTLLQHGEVRTAGHEFACLADLDGDGTSEIIVPVKNDWQQHAAHWCGVEALDGATGQARWQSRLFSIGHFSGTGMGALVLLLPGADLNGDGYRDLFLASSGETIRITDAEHKIQIDAISGKDGRQFWSQRQTVGNPFSGLQEHGLLQWGQVGLDGWPQLVVPVAKGAGGQPLTYVLSSSTGRIAHVLPEVADPQVADINNDGIADLTYITGESGSQRMTVLRGATPVEWRRPANWFPARDYDGDHIADFLETRSEGQTSIRVAHSGRDGRIVWQAKVRPAYISPLNPVLHLDCNHDGTSDMVLMEHCQDHSGSCQTVAAVSGKDGRRLWTAPPFGFESASAGSSGGGPQREFRYPMLDQRDLDGDGRPEILVAGHIGLMNTVSLAALSNEEGRLLWKIPIIKGAYVGQSPIDRHIWHDLDGDGVLDIALWVPQSIGEHGVPIGGEVRAYNGRDGASLWKAGYPGLGGLLWPRNAIADLDRDGKPEVLVTSQNPQGNLQSELAVLDGRTGERKWNWSWQRGADNIWPPLPVDMNGDGQRVICMGVHEQGPSGNVIVLDAEGKVRQRIPIGWLQPASAWMALDVDGDRREEVLYASEVQLQAYRLSDQQTLWKRPNGSNVLQLEELRPGRDGGPGTLVCWSFRTASGIDVKTGDVQWRCDVAKPDNLQLVADLSFSEDAERPLVVSHDAHSKTTLVQRAWPTNPDGVYEAPKAVPIDFPPFVAPARYRRLPWVRSVASLNPVRWINEDRLVKALLGLLEWPVFLVFIGTRLRWLFRGQWRRLLVYWLLFGVMAACFAALQLARNSRWLEADERYAWDGWYWIMWGTALPLGGLTVVAVTGMWLLKWLRRTLARTS